MLTVDLLPILNTSSDSQQKYILQYSIVKSSSDSRQMKSANMFEPILDLTNYQGQHGNIFSPYVLLSIHFWR